MHNTHGHSLSELGWLKPTRQTRISKFCGGLILKSLSLGSPVYLTALYALQQEISGFCVSTAGLGPMIPQG